MKIEKLRAGNYILLIYMKIMELIMHFVHTILIIDFSRSNAQAQGNALELTGIN